MNELYLCRRCLRISTPDDLTETVEADVNWRSLHCECGSDDVAMLEYEGIDYCESIIKHKIGADKDGLRALEILRGVIAEDIG